LILLTTAFGASTIAEIRGVSLYLTLSAPFNLFEAPLRAARLGSDQHFESDILSRGSLSRKVALTPKGLTPKGLDLDLKSAWLPQGLRTRKCQRFLNWGQSNLSRWLLPSSLDRTEKAWSDPDCAASRG